MTKPAVLTLHGVPDWDYKKRKAVAKWLVEQATSLMIEYPMYDKVYRASIEGLNVRSSPPEPKRGAEGARS